MKRVCSIFFALSLATSVAHADPNVDQAKLLFTAGAAAYDKRDYAGAIQAFEGAQRLAPHPAILFSLAQAHRRQYYAEGKLEHLQAAIAGYRDYIKQVPHGGRHDDAMQALQELGGNADRVKEHDVASVSINASNTPGARIAVDDGTPVEVPLIGPIAAGKHRVVITADGYVTETREVVAVEGKIVALDVPLKERPAKVTLVAPAGAHVDVDGRPMGETPFAAPLELTGGTHLFAVGKNGHDAFVREIDLARGEERRLDAALPSSRQRHVATAMLVSGAAAIVAGGVFTTIAFVEQGQAQSLFDKQKTQALTPAEQATYEDARSARASWAIASAVAYGTGGVLAIAGLLLYVFDAPNTTGHQNSERSKPKAPERREPAELSLAPAVGPHLLGASATIRF